MTVALVVISDGRYEVHQRSLESALEHLPSFDHYVFVHDEDHRLGFAGAVQAGFNAVLATDADYVFWLEADFTFNGPVAVDDMIALLKAYPAMTQVALKRQPVNPVEIASGGIMEQCPEAFEQRWWGESPYVVHRKWFTTNVNVFPRWIAERGWPQCRESEGHFAIDLFNEDPMRLAAYWGALADAPLVEHIGLVRVGGGY